MAGYALYQARASGQARADQATAAAFLDLTATDAARFEALFRYFLAGAVRHANHAGSRIHYPGLPSKNGYWISGLEGFARVAPLIAAWVSSGRDRFAVIDGATIDLIAFIRKGILAGTSPGSQAYWGHIKDGDQRILEAVDIGRALWLTRDLLWAKLRLEDRQSISDWLQQAMRARIGTRNNWILASTTLSVILWRLDIISAPDMSGAREFKSSYLEKGWFRDGPSGPVDYYNSWGISYELFWQHELGPERERSALRRYLIASAEFTAHLISPLGIPILGRSLTYRTAVPVPLVAGALLSPPAFHEGEARRALDLIWRYFITRGALEGGSLSLGYFAADPRLVETYSGAGSSHWGLRSLTLAFLAPVQHPFWTAAQRPLPVERDSYEIDCPKLGWRVSGNHLSQDIRVRITANHLRGARFHGMSLRDRAKQWLYERPFRPNNDELKYKLHSYEAISPLGGALGL